MSGDGTDDGVLAVFGGTFDPPHLAHLVVARHVARALGGAPVRFVPSARPPHKAHPDLTRFEDRLEMVRLAIRDEPGFTVDALEAERRGPSYTIDTLRRLRDEGVGRPVFVLGADVLAELETWHEPEALRREFDLVAVDRADAVARTVGGGAAPADARSVSETALGAGAGGSIFRVVVPAMHVASSDVRARVRAGRPIAGLVPGRVARYIHDHDLYRQGG